MKYIHFQDKYTKEVINLWNKCLFADQIDEFSFRFKTILDDNFDPAMSYLVIEDDKVIAFAYATKRKFPYLERGLEKDKGWINVLFVDPDYRRKGIGTKLYQLLEKDLVKLDTKQIILSAYSPNYYFYGLDEDNYHEAISFYKKMGFEAKESHYSMGKDLSYFKIDDITLEKQKALEEKGYKFTTFKNKYSLELLEFLKNEFGGGWKRNALIAMRDNIAEEVIIIVLDKEDKICGFSMSAIDKNPRRFGPIGIAKDKRNEGIGSVLLNYSLMHLKNRNIDSIFFMTTDDDGRRYYERNGFYLIKTVRTYIKNVSI